MIGKLKRWIEGIVRNEMEGPKVVPAPLVHGAPYIQIYRIGNGYIFYKNDNTQYRDTNPNTVIYCATPLDVARQIVNRETLDKMGIQAEQMTTSGVATGSFNKI